MNQTDPSNPELSQESQAAGEDQPEQQAVEETDFSLSESPDHRARNNALLIMLTLVVLGAGGILLMRMRAGPRPAAASPEVTSAKATINQFLSDGGKNLNAMRELLKNTEKVVQQFLNYPSMNQVKLEDLKTNPFQFFAPPKQTSAQASSEKTEQAARAEAQQAVQRLKLQSILLGGGTGTCMISNRMLTEGQEVEGFLVEKINSDSVVVKWSKNTRYRFELKIQKP